MRLIIRVRSTGNKLEHLAEKIINEGLATRQ